MLKFIIGLLLDKIIEAVREAVSDYISLQRKKKEDKDAVNNAVKIKDPKARAAAIADLLR
jgi:hypothetical protein